MSQKRRKKAFAIVAVLATILAGAATWYLATKLPSESRADDATLRDIPDQTSVLAGAAPKRSVVPQASIPWKRDSDRYVSVVIGCAQIPWLRGVEQSGSEGSGTTELAGAQGGEKWVPVFLPTAALPWHY